MAWPQRLLLLSASCSALAGILLLVEGDSFGYVTLIGSAVLAAFVLSENSRRHRRKD